MEAVAQHGRFDTPTQCHKGIFQMPSLSMSFLSWGYATSLGSPWDQGRLRQIFDGVLVYTLSQHAYHEVQTRKRLGSEREPIKPGFYREKKKTLFVVQRSMMVAPPFATRKVGKVSWFRKARHSGGGGKAGQCPLLLNLLNDHIVHCRNCRASLVLGQHCRLLKKMTTPSGVWLRIIWILLLIQHPCQHQ